MDCLVVEAVIDVEGVLNGTPFLDSTEGTSSLPDGLGFKHLSLEINAILKVISRLQEV